MTDDVIRVLLAEDHPVFLEGLVGLLATTHDLAVVGRASTGTEAVKLAERLAPDVVVIDLNLPELDGVEATRRIVGTSPHVAVLVLTMYQDEAMVFRAVQAGALGYLVKSADPEAVLGGIRAVARGEAIFGQALAGRLAAWFSAAADHSTPFTQLTAREREVLDLIARGLGNQAIAQRVGITAKTVRNLVSNLLSKLQVADRAEAVARAREAGLGRP